MSAAKGTKTHHYPSSPQPGHAFPDIFVAPHFPHFVDSAMTTPLFVDLVAFMKYGSRLHELTLLNYGPLWAIA